MCRQFFDRYWMLFVLTVLAVSICYSPSKAAEISFTDQDKKVAYCMQAEFGMAQIQSRLVQVLHTSLDKAHEFINDPKNAAQRKEATDAAHTLEADMAKAQALEDQRQAELKAIINYLQGRGLMASPNLEKVSSIGQDAQRDQQSKFNIYRACLSQCAPSDPSCRKSCNEKADSSEPSLQLESCSNVARKLH